MRDPYGELIAKLRERRQDLKMTQAQVAEKIGVNLQTLSNWELGHTHPQPRYFALWAKSVKCRFGYWLEAKENPGNVLPER